MSSEAKAFRRQLERLVDEIPEAVITIGDWHAGAAPRSSDEMRRLARSFEIMAIVYEIHAFVEERASCRT